MRILVVEDDSKIASFVAQGLREHGHAVDVCHRGDDALLLWRTVDYDLAILDVMLPGLDGLSLLEKARSEGRVTPVIILSAKATVDDRVRGLQAGGDDYLTKPFAFAELLARVQARLRRDRSDAPATRLAFEGLEMDLVSRLVRREGKIIELQPREFSLLEFLMRHPGRPVTKTMILEHVWDFHFDPQTNVVDVLVHRLRSKVDKGFDPPLIHTLRGVGYVLKRS